MELKATPHCFQCSNVEEETDCHILTQCPVGEVCYTNRTSHADTSRFSLGCANPQVCPGHQATGIIGRSTKENCFNCCLHDGCNKGLCKLEISSGSIHCFSCRNVTAVDNCHVLSQCQPNERCPFQLNLNDHCTQCCTREGCNKPLCAADGHWADWASWSRCSTTCGNGSMTRSRTCSSPPPTNGGKDCVGSNFDTAVCFVQICPVLGGWSPWGQWSACTSTCGQGIKHRTRTCTNPKPSSLENMCSGDSSEYTSCVTGACRVDGSWTIWSAWTKCSVTCGPGQMTRVRSCSNPSPVNGGTDCHGPGIDQTACGTTSCAVPINGGWASWSVWSGCSVSCGYGHITRMRTCTNPRPANGGSNCAGSNSQQQSCRAIQCPVNGGWTNWNSWSTCDTECGPGTSHIRRYCTNPTPSGTGRYCDGDPVQYKICYIHREGGVRLLNNGGHSSYGTVQLCHNGAFGTICDDGVNNDVASVICRMLGYSGGVQFQSAHFGQGSGNILLDDVRCNGHEKEIMSCSHTPIGSHNCGHSEDLGVSCYY